MVAGSGASRGRRVKFDPVAFNKRIKLAALSFWKGANEADKYASEYELALMKKRIPGNKFKKLHNLIGYAEGRVFREGTPSEYRDSHLHARLRRAMLRALSNTETLSIGTAELKRRFIGLAGSFKGGGQGRRGPKSQALPDRYYGNLCSYALSELLELGVARKLGGKRGFVCLSERFREIVPAP